MNEFQPLLDLLGGKLGWLPTLIIWIGALRIPMKLVSGFIQSALTKFVDAVRLSPERDDDELLARILGSLTYRFVAFVLDAVLSFKLPTSQSLALHRLKAADPIDIPAPVRSAIGILAFFLLPFSLCLVSGCATAPKPETLERIQTAAKLAAYIGASEYLDRHPEHRAAFELAREELRLLENAEHVDLVTLLAIVNRLPVKELKSSRAQMVVTTATILLSDYAGSLPLERLDELKPVARSIREGLDLALQPPPPPPPN